VNGSKRHSLTDTGGLLVAVVVHAANIQGRDGTPATLGFDPPGLSLAASPLCRRRL
jgi:hypothetical protein